MVCVIELELGQCRDHRATEHEHVQNIIKATHKAYAEWLDECRMLGASFLVYCVLDRLGCIVAELQEGDERTLKMLSCVKAIRESKLHKQLT